MPLNKETKPILAPLTQTYLLFYDTHTHTHTHTYIYIYISLEVSALKH